MGRGGRGGEEKGRGKGGEEWEGEGGEGKERRKGIVIQSVMLAVPNLS